MAALAAGLIALAATGLLVRLGPVDAPKDRGLHSRPTPTSGGLAIMLGFCLGMGLMLWWLPSLRSREICAVALMALTMGILGAADDVFDLGARTKLFAQVGVALIYSLLAAHIEALSTPLGSVPLGLALGVLGSTLWIVVVTNAVNFMDGANGLSPGSLIIALTALGLSCGHSLGALALMGAAAGLGFLPWNLPGGRIFQGDAGALFSSALFAGLVLMAAGPLGEGAISVWFGPLALLPLLTDVFLTLLARARRRKSLLQAHRDHLFQRWLLARKASHGALSVRVWGLMALAGLCAMGMQRLPIPQHSVVFVAALAVCVIGWKWSDRRVSGR